MSYHYGGWAPYVPVAERRREAEAEIARLIRKGQKISPVRLAGKKIAASFWGKAWCDNLESYRDYENRLPRGRSCVRNGAVIDLQIAPLEIRAMVIGSSIYTVKIQIGALAKQHWASICRDCAGGIDSLVGLLQGRLSKSVMERVCRQQGGLFPKPAEMKFSCSCPDYASMCKHVAAVLYGVGARLDEQAELLFSLRDVDHADLLTRLDAGAPLAKSGPVSGRVLVEDDLSALFGLDMGAAAAPDTAKPAKAITAKPVTKPMTAKPAAASAGAAKVKAVAGKAKPKAVAAKQGATLPKAAEPVSAKRKTGKAPMAGRPVAAQAIATLTDKPKPSTRPVRAQEAAKRRKPALVAVKRTVRAPSG